MSNQVQMTPNTNPGSSPSLSKSKEDKGPTRNELNEFLEDVAVATARGPEDGDPTPHVEASRKIIEFYNRNNMKGFDHAGYFILQGVKVYEKGKKEAADARDRMSMEQVNHGMNNIK